jgi:hypothetical protein
MVAMILLTMILFTLFICAVFMRLDLIGEGRGEGCVRLIRRAHGSATEQQQSHAHRTPKTKSLNAW